MNPHIKAVLVGLLAGILGGIVTLVGLLIVFKGDISGMAGMAFFACIMGYSIGYGLLILPLFILLWQRQGCWIWQFRFFVPLGLLLGFVLTPLIKGESLSESYMLEAALIFAVYGGLLALTYITTYKLANKTAHTNPLPRLESKF